MVHHTTGIITDVEALRAHGLPIVEDASQSLGGKTGETACGSSADVCLLSLDPEYIVTCGGGRPRARPVPPDGRGAQAHPGRLARCTPPWRT